MPLKPEVHKQRMRDDPEYRERKMAIQRASQRRNKEKRNAYCREYYKSHKTDYELNFRRFVEKNIDWFPEKYPVYYRRFYLRHKAYTTSERMSLSEYALSIASTEEDDIYSNPLAFVLHKESLGILWGDGSESIADLLTS